MSDNEILNDESVILPDFIKRMNTELTELKDKIDKLTKFMNGEIYPKLNGGQQGLMSAQLASMVSYANILSLRINGEVRLFLDTQKDESDEVK